MSSVNPVVPACAAVAASQCVPDQALAFTGAAIGTWLVVALALTGTGVALRLAAKFKKASA